MKFMKCTAILLALAAPVALAKDKNKNKVPAVFSTARFVYVQAEDGDVMNPGLFPEDRDAISNVQDGVRDWKRYTLTLNRSDADLVFIVRKGRLASGQLHGDVGVASGPMMGGAYPGGRPGGSGNPGATGNPGAPGNPGGPGNPPADPNSDRMGNMGPYQGGARSDVGPADDLLRVYTLTPDGKLSGPIWQREMQDGLDEPSIRLLRELRDAVDRAYPPQASTQPATPAKP
jgi:hypothetical protein